MIANVKEAAQVELAERLYGQLQSAGVDVLLDDRPERAGVKFKDSELLGIPWRVVVGRGAADGKVELVQRSTGDKQDLSADAVESTLLPQLQEERQGLLAVEAP